MSDLRGRVVVLVLSFLAGASIARAQCAVSIDSVSVSGGILTVQASNSGSCENSFQTSVAVVFNNTAYTGPNLGVCSGNSCSTTAQIPVTCLAPGSHPIKATGSCYDASCNFVSSEITTSFTMPSHKPEVNVTVSRSASGGYEATVDWSFKNIIGNQPRVVWLSWAPGGGDGIWATDTLPPMEGSSGPIALPACSVDGHDFLVASASTCGDEDGYAESRTPIALPDCVTSCMSCPSPQPGPSSVGFDVPVPPTAGQSAECVSMPIRVDNGSMKLTDSDLLPGQLVAPLGRTYDSIRTGGVFGRGWSSVFDSILQVQGQHVYVRTENGDRVVFARDGTDYVQVWPTVETLTGFLRYDAIESAFLYRPAGSVITRVYTNGRLTALRHAGRINYVDISYDSNGLPARIEDSEGVWGWTITTSAGRISSILPDGTSQFPWTYVRDTNGNLTSVSTPIGTWRTYTYVSNKLTEAHDGDGNLIESHAYDSSGRATTSVSAGEELASVEYRSVGRVPGETKSYVVYANERSTTFYTRFIAGRPRTVEVDGSCDCGTEDAVYVYDAFGHIIREQNVLGYIATRQYTAGRLVSQTNNLRPDNCDPATDSARCRLTPDTLASATLIATSESQTLNYVYGDANWPERPTEVSTASVLNPSQEFHRAITYDATTGEFLTSTVTGYTGIPAQSTTRTITNTLYDGTETAAFVPHSEFASFATLAQPQGLLKVANGPRTDVQDLTTYVYYPFDASVPANNRGRLAGQRNAAGQITFFADYNAFGQAGRIIDPNGLLTEIEHDDLGRETSVTQSGATCEGISGSCVITTTRSYSGTGALVNQSDPYSTSVYSYDGRGRVLTISRGPAANDLRERIAYTYDAATGQKATERSLAYESGSWVEKRSETFTYNDSGQLSQITHPDSTSIAYTYGPGARLASIRDERHASPNTFYEYDAEGRLIEVRQTLGAGEASTAYGYDLFGNLTTVTDPNGNTTTYLYDDFGQLLRQISPVSGTTLYAYDATGNLLSTTDANSATTTRTYDLLGRILTSSATRSASTETVTWTYDTAPNGVGRIATMTDPTGTTSYEYERRGLLTKETKTIGSSTYLSTFGYDKTGNRARMVYPGGRVVLYAYDFAGRPLSVTADATTIVSAATYLPFGPRTSMTFGNGTSRSMSYDSQYRLLTNELSTVSGSIADYTYQHDAAGNISSITDQLDATYNRSFDYDDLNRLITANAGTSLWGSGAYTYDAMGNLLTLNIGTRSATFSRSGTTPKLTSVTDGGVTQSVTYDSAGNETGVGTKASSYSARNHLTTYDGHDYAYDGRGIRLVTTTAGLLTELNLGSTVGGGNSLQGSVVLAEPAPAGGVIVALSSDNSVATVPATVTITASATSVTFTIQTVSVDSSTSAAITASFGGVTLSSTLQVLPAVLDSISAPSNLRGGTTGTGTVYLTALTTAMGKTVALSSNDTVHLTVPASVTIPAGEDHVTFTITTPAAVATATPVTITASLDSMTKNAVVDVVPPAITSLVVSPSSAEGGTSLTATVSLQSGAAAGTQVTFSSTDSAMHAPVALTVATGATSAQTTVTTDAVASTTSAVLTASLPPTSQTASVTLQPLSVTLSALSINPTSMIGSNYGMGTVTLTAAAPTGGVDVELTPFEDGTVPPYVRVPAGNTQATFTIKTSVVASSTSIVITARHAVTTRSATLTVLPPVDGDVFGFSLPDLSVWGTVPANDTVTFLTGRSGSSGSHSATLQSSNSSVLSVPSSTGFTNGGTTGSFNTTTHSVTGPTDVTISGSYRGMVARQTVTVDDTSEPLINVFSIPSVVGGNTVQGSVTLWSEAPSGGFTVTLTGSRDGLASVPASVTIPEGESGATFTITTQPTTVKRGVIVEATGGNIARSAVFAVNPPTSLQQIGPISLIAPVFSADDLIAMTSSAPSHVATTTNAVPISRYSFYTPELSLLAETVTSNLPSKPLGYEYIWFGGEPVAQIETASNTTHWYFNDHLGTPILTTSTTATVDWRIERDAYGPVALLRTGANRHQPLGFPGQETSDDGDVAYNVFRWYRAGWGRYTQSDPIGVGGLGILKNERFVHWPHAYTTVISGRREDKLLVAAEMNGYGYVAANPLSFSDPNGLERIYCAVKAMWEKPIWGECIYGGICIGGETKNWYMAFGGVTPAGPCKRCSPICTFNMIGDTYTQAPMDWKCSPPMPITGYINPNPTMPYDPPEPP